jgi:hypothetical protein
MGKRLISVLPYSQKFHASFDVGTFLLTGKYTTINKLVLLSIIIKGISSFIEILEIPLKIHEEGIMLKNSRRDFLLLMNF